MASANGPLIRVSRNSDGKMGCAQLGGSYGDNMADWLPRSQGGYEFPIGNYGVTYDDGSIEIIAPTPAQFAAGWTSYGLVPTQWTQLQSSLTAMIPAPSQLVSFSTPVIPSRAIGTAFQPPNNDCGCSVSYGINIASTLTLTAGSAGHVDLLIGPSSTSLPYTADTFGGGITGTLVVGLSIAVPNRGSVKAIVPAGWWCKLVSTNDSGTPTFSIVSQLEIPF